MLDQKKTYRARDPFEASSWFKRLLKKIEYGNKFLTMRLLGKLLRIRPLTKPIPLEEVSSVLIIRYDALGDMIVTTPLWRLLKKLKPGIKIGVAGSYKNLDLLQADPDIDVVYDYSASSMKEFIRLTKEARKQPWDVVIACNFVDRTRNAIIARLSSPKGITATIGKPGKEGADRLFSRYMVLPKSEVPMPMVSQLQYLLRSAIDLPTEDDIHPSLRIDRAIEQSINTTIKNILDGEGATDYIVINTDAKELRQWDLAKNIALATFIADQYPRKVVFLTSMPEQQAKVVAALENQNNSRARFFPTKNVQELIALIRGSSLVITPDTSVSHIASAENKPIVAFYPVANDWLPYKTPSIIILPETGKQISDIPLEIAKNSVVEMLTSFAPNCVKIIPSEDPSNSEIRYY